MDYTEPQYWPQLKDLAIRMEHLDYYQILNVLPTASLGEIARSYYGMARSLHPDKFFHLEDAELRRAVTLIYKRITEAYSILKDEGKRKIYTQGIQGPQRMERLRYDENMEAEHKEAEKQAVKIAKTPRGEEQHRLATLDMRAGRWKDAYHKIQSALLFEPGNAEFKKLLNELDEKRKQ